MSKDTLTQLKQIEDLADVPDEQLLWFIDKSETIDLKEGDHVFTIGKPVTNLFIVLTGHIEVRFKQGGQFRLLNAMKPGSISGLLPYSRLKVSSGNARALEETAILSLSKEHFQEMIHDHYELTEAMVHVMTSRTREFAKVVGQNEKLLSLGKLSAGIAHEMNNPASAVIRSASELKKHLGLLPEEFKQVLKIKLEEEQLDAINDILFAKLALPKPYLTLMEKTEKEDEIGDWLEERDVEDGYEIAETFAEYGIELEDLERIEGEIEEEDLAPIMNWFNQVLTTEKLVHEIEEASKRISSIVSSVKSYTHMDQAPELAFTDIHTGINNTLIMLNHKIKKGKIEVVKNYQTDLPGIKLYISEINQVWTNLIDNAIDAMEDSEKRVLEIETKLQLEFIHVNIIDSGPGIPEEVRDKIFDPFFTTKKVGKGSGLGLDVAERIVNQHKGAIRVTTEPGRTEFKVCIPLWER
ncbi:MAG: ATP-binding protein [Bacteroidota bacterium]